MKTPNEVYTVRIPVRVTPKMHRALKKMCAVQGYKISALGRELFAQAIAQENAKSKRKPKSLGGLGL